MRRSVLFLCTGNSCRSQMAEAILKHLDSARFEALSAGSYPAGYVHEVAVETLRRMGIDIANARSKSWDEFANRPIDVVITLCDDAAGEACPNWPGDPVRAHWSLPDPAFHPGTDDERLAFAEQVAWRLKHKIRGLIDSDFDAGREELTKRLAQLGEI